MYEEHKIPLQIFRLSGIYSNKNNVLERIKSGNGNIIKKKSIFSRIHVEDIQTYYLYHLINLKKVKFTMSQMISLHLLRM